MLFQNLRMSFFVLTFILSLITIEAYSQEKILEVGEELKYEVSYGFIKLGEIKFILTSSRKEGKRVIYNAKFEIKSYPEVPFVKINEILETEMEFEDQGLFSDKFYETRFKDKSISRADYKFNYASNYVKVIKETDGNVEKNVKIPVKKNVKYKDEVSWHYNARLNSFTNKNYNVPVFINDEESSVRYSFNVNKTVINIEKFNYDIAVIKMEGIADYIGYFGFKGEFLILLSDDDYRVPIKAYFNSSLGNVTWELISYKKNKWKPPAFLK